MKIQTIAFAFIISIILLSCTNDDNKTPQTNRKPSADANQSKSVSNEKQTPTDSSSFIRENISDNLSKKWSKYNIKSGIVEYRLSGIDGTETVYWDNYGALELRNSRTKQSTDGGDVESNSLVLYIDSMLYQIDLNAKKGIKINLNKYLGGKTNMKVFSKDLLKQLNGERKGTEIILGRQNDVWLLGDGAKVCLFNDIPFSIEMGKISIKAVKYEENIVIPAKIFALPKGIEIRESDSPTATK